MEAAGSVAAAAPSESHSSSGQHGEESLAQQGGSVNWGQATAQSPVRACRRGSGQEFQCIQQPGALEGAWGLPAIVGQVQARAPPLAGPACQRAWV